MPQTIPVPSLKVVSHINLSSGRVFDFRRMSLHARAVIVGGTHYINLDGACQDTELVAKLPCDYPLAGSFIED